MKRLEHTYHVEMEFGSHWYPVEGSEFRTEAQALTRMEKAKENAPDVRYRVRYQETRQDIIATL